MLEIFAARKFADARGELGGYGGGHLQADSFDEVQRHEEQRRRLAQEVKEARQQATPI